MGNKTAALIAGSTLMFSLSTATAGGAYELSPRQMDSVSAGATRSFTRTFVLSDPFAPRRIADTITLETPNGTLTGVFDAIFISFRAGGTRIDFNKSIRTVATFN
jgi:hypothetical protein